MSTVASASGALGIVVFAGTIGVVGACGGRGGDDLFAPSTTTSGPCDTSCPSDASAPPDRGAGGASSSSTATTTGSGGTDVGAGGATTGQGTSGGSGGAATTGSAGAATGGGTGGMNGGGTGNGGAGSAGTGGGGSPATDSGVSEDASTIDAAPIDSGRADRAVDAIVVHDACISNGAEICDGLDNNCNGSVDERACPNGCTGASYNGTGYMFCFGQNQLTAWRTAEAQCVASGMHLVRVDDAEQNAWIRKTANAAGHTGIIWIGGSDTAREGNWIWTDGTQFWMGLVNGRAVNGHYTDWDTGQPNSASGQEDCAAMWMTSEKWHDDDCLTHYAFMCQGPKPIR